MSWEIVKLDSCVNILSGFAFKSNCFNSNQEGMPLIRIRNVVESKIETYYSGEYDDQYLIKKGDLLVGMDGDFNRQKWNNEPALLNQRVCKITPISEKINASYLYHLLPKELDRIHAITPCVTVKHLSVQKIKDIELILPSLPEQQRIADILDKAEAITQKRAQVLTLCDEFLRATFLDMFGDPVSNPKGWEVDRLKNLTSKIGSGSTPRGGKESYLDSGMTLVRSLNVYDDEFVRRGLAFISEAQADKLSNVALKADDILLNITGASVCRCSMMDNSLLPARVNQHVCIIRPNGIDNLFLLHLLISKSYKRKLMTLATSGGATREALTKEDITELGIIVPPIEFQQRFSNIVEKVNGIKARIQEAQELPIFDALSQQAFKGELTQ